MKQADRSTLPNVLVVTTNARVGFRHGDPQVRGARVQHQVQGLMPHGRRAAVALRVDRRRRLERVVPAQDLPARAPTLAGRSIQRDMVPEDMVGALLFLAAPDSDFITGQTMNIDGGKITY